MLRRPVSPAYPRGHRLRASEPPTPSAAAVTPSESEALGYSPVMADKTEKKKTPLAGWIIAVIAVGLLIMLVIGIAVL